MLCQYTTNAEIANTTTEIYLERHYPTRVFTTIEFWSPFTCPKELVEDLPASLSWISSKFQLGDEEIQLSTEILGIIIRTDESDSF